MDMKMSLYKKKKHGGELAGFVQCLVLPPLFYIAA